MDVDVVVRFRVKSKDEGGDAIDTVMEFINYGFDFLDDDSVQEASVMWVEPSRERDV